jgi:hypothetical protein
VDAEDVANIHYQEIFQLYSIPMKIVLDQGPQFAAQLMKALYQQLGITHTLTTAYYSQSNGQTKHTNQKVKQYLQLFASAHHVTSDPLDRALAIYQHTYAGYLQLLYFSFNSSFQLDLTIDYWTDLLSNQMTN